MVEKLLVGVGLWLTLATAPALGAAPMTTAPVPYAPAAPAPAPAPLPAASSPAPATTAPAAPAPATTSPPAATPAPYPGYPPASTPYYAPPPGYAYPTPGYGYPGYGPYQPGWQHAAYESQKRSPGVALLLEFLLPGGGSIYGDHIVGAVVNWGLEIGGLVLIIHGANQAHDCSSGYCSSTNANDTEIGVGLLMLVTGRVYGFIDAYSSTHRYNQKLLQRFGLPPWMAMQVGVTPIRSPGSVAYAPTLQLRF